MASTRQTFFTAFTTQLAAISGIISSGNGIEIPDLLAYAEAELPWLWVIHPKTFKMVKIPNYYKYTERVPVILQYADWNIIPNQITAENWIELIVDTAEADWCVSGTVNYIESRAVELVTRNFPIAGVKVTFDVTYHVLRDNF